MLFAIWRDKNAVLLEIAKLLVAILRGDIGYSIGQKQYGGGSTNPPAC